MSGLDPLPSRGRALLLAAVLLAVVPLLALRGQTPTPAAASDPFPMPAELAGVDLLKQTAEQAFAKSAGCVQCHQNTCDPHAKETLHLGCCDCHGGDPSASAKEKAHVAQRFADAWPTSANPVRSYTMLNYESPDFVR